MLGDKVMVEFSVVYIWFAFSRDGRFSGLGKVGRFYCLNFYGFFG